MLVIRVELHSAITGLKKEIACMVIANDGSGDRERGNYWGRAYRVGHDPYKEPNTNIIRSGVVKDYPRLKYHVWNLVHKMLTSMRYR